MKVQELWNYHIPPTDENNPSLTNDIWSMVYNTEGTLLFVTSSNGLAIFDPLKGEMLKSKILPHSENIYAIALSRDGKRMATGSSDKSVISWNALTLEAEGKFMMADGVQTLSFNPLTHQLFAGSGSDCLIWTPDEEKKFEKKGHPQKILCSVWSPDGTCIAFGDQAGVITVRDGKMRDKFVIQRKAPVWCMDFTPLTPDYSTTQLIVATHDKTISVYDSAGSFLREVKLAFNLYSLQCFGGGDFFVGAGQGGIASLFSREGVTLEEISKCPEEWIWSVKIRPKSNVVVLGSNNGNIRSFKLVFQVVHGLYRDQYLFREMLTDVVVRNLVKDQSFRLKCRELVKRVSVYQDSIAVQLPSKILIYKQTKVESGNQKQANSFKYGLIQKINKKFECSLLVLTSQNLVLCFERKLQLYTWTGNLVREWTMESMTRYLKVLGGPPGKESLLVGLKNGNVNKIFVNIPFPSLLVSHKAAVRCVDINITRTLLAIVDEHSNLTVYNIETKEQLFMEMNVSSVSWNSDMEDLLAYSGGGMLYIKAGLFPPAVQKQSGYVVGFQGSKLYVLCDLNMVVIEVSQTNSLIHYIEKRDYKTAFKVANLGLTEQDFRLLGIEALCNSDFEIARKCFVHLKDMGLIELVAKYEREKKNNTLNEVFMQSEVLAYQNRLREAGNLLVKAGQLERAVELFVDTRRWSDAIECFPKMSTMHNKNDPNRLNLIKILREEAEWHRRMGDWAKSAEILVSCEDYKKAIEILGAKGDIEKLLGICRVIDKNTYMEEIKLCAHYFKQHNAHSYAKEAYLKLGDSKQLLDAYVEMERWEEAMTLAKNNPSFMKIIKLPYADHLAKSDRFDEAQVLYKEAGRPDLSMRIVERLCKNAISELRFDQVGSFFWILAKEHLHLVKSIESMSPEDSIHFSAFQEFNMKADIYSAYKIVHEYIEMQTGPQTQAKEAKTVFNAARFILCKVKPGALFPGINMAYVYYALGKVSSMVGAFKTSRMAFERLNGLIIPSHWAEEVDLTNLLIRSKPFSDSQGSALICMRCMNQNLTIAEGGICNTCFHPYYFSSISFEALPVIEFFPEDQNLPHHSVVDLLYAENDSATTIGSRPGGDGWKETYGENQQTLIFSNNRGEPGDPEDEEDTPFLRKVTKVNEAQLSKNDYVAVQLTNEEIKSLSFDEVSWQDMTNLHPEMPIVYLKNMLPDIPFVRCSDCSRFFLTVNLKALKGPSIRNSVGMNYGRNRTSLI